MNNRSRNILLAGISTVSLFFAYGANAYAADVPDATPDASAELDTLVVTARGKPRTVLDSAVPVDSFSEADLKASTFTDTNDILKTLVPSYTLAREPISDGATFIRPASLRGLPTDKTLFMVNGKRRHRSALVSIGGTGAQAPDAATIPASALKNVVVTRDGAGAQYGSDAIAGVIDFQLKDSPSGGSLTAQYGQYYLGDGEDVLVTGNLGLPIGDKGFVNGTFEYTSQNQVNRGRQYCNVGIPNQSPGFCVSQYAATNPAYGALIHDYVQKWGQPDAEATRAVVNTGYEFSETVSAYAFANYSKSSATEYFNYRPPVSNAVNATPIRKSDGSTFQFSSIFPAGFTPMFGGDITDYSLAGGLKGKFSSGLTYDISGRYGNDKLSYTLWDTVNPSMGPDSPKSFYVGSLISTETAANADFAYDWGVGGFDTPVTINFGAEYRKEGYEIEAGDVASYKAGTWAVPNPFGFCNTTTHTPTAAATATVLANGLNCANYDTDTDGTGPDTDVDGFAGDDPVYHALAVGSNGAPGSPPDYSGKLTRDSYAGYVETSANITEAWFLDLALRGEHFSDFGGTVNGKIATQYQINDAFGIRGSIGTGFRAPTPGQLFTTNVSTRVENGAIIASGLFPATNPVAQFMGAKELKPEKSLNMALGFTATLFDGLSLTVDAYSIKIDDQFYATTPITVTQTIRDALIAANVPGAATIGQVQFYQNAFDSTTWGVDVVATYKVNWENGQSTSFTASGNWNHFVVDKVFSNQFFDGEGVYDFKHAQPQWRGVFSANHEIGKFKAIGRLNLWGGYKNMFSATNPVIQKFDPEAFVDLELSYRATDTYTVSVGARNLFANYPAPDLTGESATNGRIYRSDSIVDWQGGFWYLKASASF